MWCVWQAQEAVQGGRVVQEGFQELLQATAMLVQPVLALPSLLHP